MDKLDLLRHAIGDVLCSGVEHETKIENLVHVFNNNQQDGIIVGWLEVQVRTPDLNTYIDYMMPDKTKVFERLLTDNLLRHLRQNDALWRPAIK